MAIHLHNKYGYGKEADAKMTRLLTSFALAEKNISSENKTNRIMVSLCPHSVEAEK